jgi:iron-sulfur cluster repair protein YtfE (RIC family)
MAVARITGPLRAWYDIHEALLFEARALATQARATSPLQAEALARRYAFFEAELRLHSSVEDGLMFPAMREAGGHVDPVLSSDHQRDQLVLYDVRCALLEAEAFDRVRTLERVVETLDVLAEHLARHFSDEEETALVMAAKVFSDAEQGRLLKSIFRLLPPDPHLEPWILSSLTPEHRVARLRNLISSLPPPRLEQVLEETRAGVSPDIWRDLEHEIPELARSQVQG